MYNSSESDIIASLSSSVPATYDYLKPNGFRFALKEIPNVSYTCQEVSLPSLELGYIEQPTPKLNLFLTGHKLTYGDFAITFIVSEGLQNYKELYDWMFALGDNEGGEKYRSFLRKRASKDPTFSIDNIKSDSVEYSDGTLFVLNSSNNPKLAVNFKNLFPVALSELSFNTKVTDIQYFVCTATFKYRSYELIPL